jgi:drug/metabolite transporter (DMT)-like permease
VRGLAHPDPVGLAFGAAIACCIAGYTLIDKQGIRYAAPVPYLELSMILPTLAYAGMVIRLRSAAVVRAAFGPAPVVAGIATFVAYGCVLAALSRAPAASVAAVRETSVVVAAALAAVVLKERVTRGRMLGACAVVAGIALLG